MDSYVSLKVYNIFNVTLYCLCPDFVLVMRDSLGKDRSFVLGDIKQISVASRSACLRIEVIEKVIAGGYDYW